MGKESTQAVRLQSHQSPVPPRAYIALLPSDNTKKKMNTITPNRMSPVILMKIGGNEQLHSR
jgi:hypothetical protein